VDWYVLGDAGRSCSQNARLNSVTAYYTSPVTLASVSAPATTKALAVGVAGKLAADGMEVTVFSVSPAGAAIPLAAAAPTQLKLQVRTGPLGSLPAQMSAPMRQQQGHHARACPCWQA